MRLKPILKLKDLRLFVHLGCSAAERENRQEVALSASFQFKESPPGEKTDQLQDTLCYAKASQELKCLVELKEYQLVESLGYESYQLLKNLFPHSMVQVEVHKLHPPVENLRKGVVYLCGDQFE